LRLTGGAKGINDVAPSDREGLLVGHHDCRRAAKERGESLGRPMPRGALNDKQSRVASRLEGRGEKFRFGK
jgi:hypothetical protein